MRRPLVVFGLPRAPTRRARYRTGVWYLPALALAQPVPATPFERHAPCDIPSAVLAGASAPDLETCEARCTATLGCGAYTFVSGWDHCKLHAATDRWIAVRMVAALGTSAGVGAPTPGHDNTGKDLDRAPRDLPTAEACGDACLQTAGCLGYSYVEGYRSCWLKRTEGVLVPKTFACGIRARTE